MYVGCDYYLLTGNKETDYGVHVSFLQSTLKGGYL